jgi:hypothetical protein
MTQENNPAKTLGAFQELTAAVQRERDLLRAERTEWERNKDTHAQQLLLDVEAAVLRKTAEREAELGKYEAELKAREAELASRERGVVQEEQRILDYLDRETARSKAKAAELKAKRGPAA